ncbi:hypothetical protein [Enterobacter cloacae complex sp. 288G10]|uniref:hypothetical protein n=1 Tax=Enterobacter cloacae complex sp. 288G10 TaxID=3395859 RepID=UPI003CF18E62
MKLSQLEAGMTVWSLFRTKMDNTTIKTVTLHSVVIQEVYDNHVIASWNRIAPRRFGKTAISSWKKDKPLLIRDRSGSARLATREEKSRILESK